MKKYSKPHFFKKKVTLIFVARRSLPFKRDLTSRNGFFRKYAFLRKLLNNKIFSTYNL